MVMISTQSIEHRPVDLTVSVVSHGHADLIENLLLSLEHFPNAWTVQSVVLTVNLVSPSEQALIKRLLTPSMWRFKIHVIENAIPKGFGANHNAAFKRCDTPYFAVINPDIVFTEREPVPSLQMVASQTAACFYPIQVNADGERLDSERALVTPGSVFMRQVLRMQRASAAPDWVNGACMIFRSDVYRAFNGFDERYFMYCEDVDMCLRLQLAGYSLQAISQRVIHNTRRNTLKSNQHFRWHLHSLLRLWMSKPFWQYWWMKRKG
jgi:N-acetylglucosaminyl-diphospho-decaprenol L-rhamnosyltransferase